MTCFASGSDFIPADVIDVFYAPVQHDALTELVSRYEADKAKIHELHDYLFKQHSSSVVHYFLDGNEQTGTADVSRMFALDGALQQLTADSWQRVMNCTGLLDEMPHARRQQWFHVLRAWKERGYKRGTKPEDDLLEFSLDNVRATVQGLILRRPDFLAERIEGLFFGLSPDHKTNKSFGFSKRMIFPGALSYSGIDTFHDLRLVVAKFMGRGEVSRASTETILNLCAHSLRTGKWQELDGGALRVRVYNGVGTAHIEVHEELAWRLNAILAHLHPAAIPASLREAPKTRKRTGFGSVPLHDRPIPGPVLSALAELEQHYELVPATRGFERYQRVGIRNAVSLAYHVRDKLSKAVSKELAQVLTAIGGVHIAPGRGPCYWQFDYHPRETLDAIITSGVIPDVRSYQFYGTPEPVASQLVDWLDIQEAESVCEPEAGQAGIAKFLPRDRTVCVEISQLHCTILQSMGFDTVEGDSLSWQPAQQFDVVAMNPPFDSGRWEAHLANAARLLKPQGRIGAVLPMSARSRAHDLLPGFDLEFSAPIDNAFSGTSISVVLLKATRNV